MQDNDTRGSLGEKFSQFGAPPKKNAWEAIAAELDEPKSKRRAIIWWWSSGIAATLFIGWLVVTLQQGTSVKKTADNVTSETTQRQKTGTSPAKTNTATADLTINDSSPQATSLDARSGKQTTAAKHRVAEKKQRKNRPDKNYSPSGSQVLPFYQGVLVDDLQNDPKSETDQQQIVPTDDRVEHANDSLTENDLAGETSENDSSEDEPNVANALKVVVQYPKWRFGIYGMTANNDTDDQPVSEFSNESINNSSADQLGWNTNNQQVPQMRKDVGLKVTAGRAFLKGRLWVESGVQYNRYVTKRYEDLGPELLGNLTHESVGVPLTLSYNVVSYRRFTVGVSAGIVNQFFFKTVKNILIDNTFSIMTNETLEGTTSFNERFHLLSGIAGLEINYAITARWQLSLQPQFRYYLGTGTSSPWSDTFQRSWFGASAGIRYTIYK